MALMIPAFCKRTKQDRTVEEASRPSSVPSSPWTRRRAMPRWPAHARTARHDAERHSRLAMWCHAGVGIRLPGWVCLSSPCRSGSWCWARTIKAHYQRRRSCAKRNSSRSRDAVCRKPIRPLPLASHRCPHPAARRLRAVHKAIDTYAVGPGRAGPWGCAAPRCPTAAALCLSGGLSVAVAVALSLCVWRAHA